jgi:thiol-disulfide isomerase/thioredoxin
MNKKNIIAAIFVAILFGAAGAYASLQQTGPAPAPPVAALYSQSLADASGKQQALSQWKGKALLVNFWAPWCGPCVREMPELSALAQDSLGKKVQVIGIGIDSPSNIAEFGSKLKISYPIYVAGMSGTDLSRQFGNTSGGLPFTVLIGADGQIKKTYLGSLKFDQLKADLKAL